MLEIKQFVSHKYIDCVGHILFERCLLQYIVFSGRGYVLVIRKPASSITRLTTNTKDSTQNTSKQFAQEDAKIHDPEQYKQLVLCATCAGLKVLYPPQISNFVMGLGCQK